MFDQKAIFANAKSLSDLIEVCNNMASDVADLIDWSDLPTFGEAPANTQDIWSWDDTSLMIADSRGTSFMRVERASYLSGDGIVKV